MKLYLNKEPRTFILTDSSCALVIRHPTPLYLTADHPFRLGLSLANDRPKHKDKRTVQAITKSNAIEDQIIVEFLKKEVLDLSTFQEVFPERFLNVKGNVHLGFITKSIEFGHLQLGESIHKIEDVDFYCLNSDIFDGWLQKRDEEADQTSSSESSLGGYPAASVKKLLSLGDFYFSPDFDITCTIQERGASKSSKYVACDHPYFSKFSWNSFMISGLVEFRSVLNHSEREQFDKTGFLTVITRGFAQTTTFLLDDFSLGRISLISKQSCKKKGDLFGESGCDDEGEVSNFIETEVIISSDTFLFSYVLVRGNVPTFWELQPSISKKTIISSNNTKRLVLTRSFEVSHHALTRHLDGLSTHFGDVHIVNCLLKDPKTYKGQLNEIFTKHINDFIYKETRDDSSGEREAETPMLHPYQSKFTLTEMPLSTALIKKTGYRTSNPPSIVSSLSLTIIRTGALFFDIRRNTYIGKQLGVFRINSFDCLAKANFVSKVISQEVILLAFRDMRLSVSADLLTSHAALWMNNLTILKKLSASYVAPSIKAARFQGSDASLKHLPRKYLNVIRDPKTHDSAMLKLLGRLQNQVTVTLHNPLHRFISSELSKQSQSFTSEREVQIFSATFNVNGTVLNDDSLADLIYPPKYDLTQDYDIACFGFQEIVELTPGQMMSTKSDNFFAWEKIIKSVLELNGSRKYVSLWSCQMGGMAMLLFIKESQLENVSGIEGSLKKTGLGGMSANKGGIAVSFSYSRTLFCFVCSHLAAGQSNVDERHQNYKTISQMMFSKNRNIRKHDAVIWLGDFNFRIDLPIDRVKSLVMEKKYQELFEFDQLNKQMADGGTFPFYYEMEIRFPPTYKFDPHTSNYDTSEKQRIPAWTDRILSLSKDDTLKQEIYDYAGEVVFSDHKPVYAIFTATVKVVDEKARMEIAHQIYDNYNTVGSINELLTANDVSRFITDSGSNNIPPPSSEISKWWLQSGAPAKVQVWELDSQDSTEGQMIINPGIPSNPFLPTTEPEFITGETS